jgi:GNAT superfamily N-acetyltransferase
MDNYYDYIHNEIARARRQRDRAIAHVIFGVGAVARSSFRIARPSDASTIAAIVNAAFSGDGGSGWTDEGRLFEGDRTYPGEILALLAVPESKFLLWIHQGEIAGCAYLRRFGNAAYMGMLAVRPLLQGIGVGKQIIAESERIAREEMRCSRMMIGVITNHRPDLAAFYERRGYERTGRIKPFEGSQALREKKELDVRAEWMEKALVRHLGD